MQSELIPLSFDKIMQTKSYTVVVLGTREKKFAIYTEPHVGKTIQTFLAGTEKPRPLTHDLIDMILRSMDVKVLQVVITDIQDTIYFARLFLEQYTAEMRHIVEIDARPSDSITLALMHNAPVYCTKDVLDRTVAVQE
jgi:bifunctional DNase/RNase